MRAGLAFAAIAVVVSCVATGSAAAVELTELDGLEGIYGRYAPAGDCQREPRITVEHSGITFELAGQTDKPGKVEFAASYSAPDYAGILKVIFPFTNASGYPIVMFFNQDEKPGALDIQGHDEGWQGGPPLAARYQALVEASPYARCK
jgi:hypothetical protein